MRIAICDDEKIFCKSIWRFLNQYFARRERMVSLSAFFNGKALIREHEKEKFDLVFLDVEMPEENGFAVAKQLLAQHGECKIIFLTNHEEWVREAFKVRAYRYLYKKQWEFETEEALRELLEEMDDRQGLFVISDDRKNVFFRFHDIIYMESLGDFSCIYTKDARVIVRASLKKMELELDHRFYRCHNQYIVNFQFIMDYEKRTIRLKDQTEIPLARARKKKFLEAFHQYLMPMR